MKVRYCNLPSRPDESLGARHDVAGASHHGPQIVQQVRAHETLVGLRRPRKDSPNTGWGNESFRGYPDYTQSVDFASALDALIGAAAHEVVVVIKGFVARQHAADRRVLLWVPAYHAEGLEKSMCVLEKGTAMAADVTNSRYRQMLRSRIEFLVRGLGVDGFKEDWVSGVTASPGAQLSEPVIGIEFERRFQSILYDEAHRWKADAMIETQTPNPLFRESSDVLRLNDIWYGARDIVATMKRRARIAHVAGWPLVDCDDGSSTDLEEWWNYMQAQPSIGIPSLYVVSRMKTTLETIPDRDWTYLAALWKQYMQALS